MEESKGKANCGMKDTSPWIKPRQDHKIIWIYDLMTCYGLLQGLKRRATRRRSPTATNRMAACLGTTVQLLEPKRQDLLGAVSPGTTGRVPSRGSKGP